MTKVHKILLSVLSPWIFINSNALDISINGSNELISVNNVVYDYQANPRTLSFKIDASFDCSIISNSSIVNTFFNTIDENGLLNNNIISTIYDVTTGIIDITTDPNIQCADNGDASIFHNGFDNELRLIITTD